jgi:non-specific serine/threonine protein kinase
MGLPDLRERRRALHLTQAQLGRVLGVPANTVARWERGDLPMRHAELVASALDNLAVQTHQNLPAVPPHNLPSELSSFVGRQRQLVDVLQQLGAARLLTLTGPGGVGKTRMALRLARDARDQSDGALFVDLAPVADDSLVGVTIAAALGLRERPGEPILQTIAHAIGSQRLLLVLDNCEHLLLACAELADGLLRSCPNLTILATSREALHIPGESTWPVPPLCPPEPNAVATPETLQASEAVQLFVERAGAVVPGFALTPDNSAPVAQICRRLDGVPLALELAAARLNVLGPNQIASRLEDRFDLLVRGPRTAPARQQTIRTTLDWSYDLLGESERRLFNRLAIFAGEWDLEATEAVCAGEDMPPPQVLELLTCLVDKSMVMVSGTEPRRYRILETLRAYALRRLELSGEADRMGERHAVFALGLAKRLGSVVSATGPGANHALDQLKWNLDNLRTALRWAVDTSAADIALRLAGALAEVWYRLGSFGEGSYWLAKVLALPDASAPTFERGWALNGAGWLALCQGQYPKSRALNEESLAIGRALDHSLLVSRGLINLGVGAFGHGDYDSARGLFEEALMVAHGDGDSVGEGMVLNNLSEVALETCDFASGEVYGRKALAVGSAQHSAWLIAGALHHIGEAAYEQGKVAAARIQLNDSIVAARACGNRMVMASALDALGNVALADAHTEQAVTVLRESLQLLHEVGGWPLMPTTLEKLAQAYATRSDPARAARALGVAVGLRENLQIPRTPREESSIGLWLRTAPDHLRANALEVARAGSWAEALEQIVADVPSPEKVGPAAPILSRFGAQPGTAALTARELEVVALVARGLTNRQIATQLVITERTTENHLRHIFDKLGAHSRAQVVAMAVAESAPAVPLG